MNLLFICSKNKLRSPTAENVFSAYAGINAIGCGINADSETPLSGDLVKWADVIFAMEAAHKKKISTSYQNLLKGKKVVCLSIPDNYAKMDPELIRLLEVRVAQHVHLQSPITGLQNGG